jgi:predicted O-methyltransferase YrrM
MVKTSRPKLVLEVGTWYGGGSTLYIASALRDVGEGGKLITCELDKDRYSSAKSGYESKPEFNVELRNSTAKELFADVIYSGVRADMLFMDGSEDPTENLEDFKLIEDHLPSGSIVGFHDWDLDVRIDGNISRKNELLRPYIENSTWVQLELISKPFSVGMSFWSRPW